MLLLHADFLATSQFAVSVVAGSLIGAVVQHRMSQRRSRGAPRAQSRVVLTRTPSASRRAAFQAERSVTSVATIRDRLERGRLALPSTVADMVVGEGEAIERVDRFVDELLELTRPMWLEIGKEVVERGRDGGAWTTACAIVSAVIAHRGLSIAAWYARDQVETSVYLAARPNEPASSLERKLIAAAHGAAEQAALAILVQPWLDARDFATACDIFSERVLVTI
jgi:hypothetical protein